MSAPDHADFCTGCSVNISAAVRTKGVVHEASATALVFLGVTVNQLLLCSRQAQHAQQMLGMADNLYCSTYSSKSTCVGT